MEEEEGEEEKEEGVGEFRMESLEGQAVGLRGPHLVLEAVRKFRESVITFAFCPRRALLCCGLLHPSQL